MSRITTRDVESKVLSELAQSVKIKSSVRNVPPKVVKTKNFIHEMSQRDKILLCEVLEDIHENDKEFWKRLAEGMKLSGDQIQQISRQHRQNSSIPIFEELLIIFGDQDKTVNQLFIALARLKVFKGMNVLKKFVDEKYHKYYETENENIPIPESNPAPSCPDLSELLRNSMIVSTSNNIEEPSADLPLVLNMSSSVQTGSNTTDTGPSITAPSLVSSEIDKREFLNSVPEVEYEELTEATNNWDPNNVLGRGGFGTVFRGIWKFTQVAIKRIEPRDKNSRADYKLELKQSLNELRFLNSCRHDNVLPLYGYSLMGAHPCLIYQLMLGGTLEQRLYSTNSLSWQQKYCIALGTARGLQYLHTFRSDKPLIHGDIKPANILLDQCLTPRIGDFGLTRESPSRKPVEISKVYGTRPYLPAEFIETRCLSTKIDTYSFGIVLYEMATKKKVYDKNRNPMHLVELMRNYHAEKLPYTEVIDITYPFDQVASFVFSILTKLGQDCTAVNPNDRPEMQVVCRKIESFAQQPQQQQQQQQQLPETVGAFIR